MPLAGAGRPSGRPQEAVRSAEDLVAEAERALRQREEEDQQEYLKQEVRRERIGSVLATALEVAEADPCPENVADLERAIEVAKRAGVLPELRVRARRFLGSLQRSNLRAERSEQDVRRLTRQLSMISDSAHPSVAGSSTSSTSDGTSRFRRREQLLREQLSHALAEAKRAGAGQDLLTEAAELLEAVERRRRSEDLAAKRLQGLLSVDDAGRLEEQLQWARGRSEVLSDSSQRIMGEIEERVARLAQREQHERWLRTELCSASEQGDLPRMHQLCAQAKLLDLAVPPAMITRMHELEASQVSTAKPAPAAPSAPASARGQDPRVTRLKAFADRRREAIEAAVAEAEEMPDAENLDAARQAIVDAKLAKVAAEALPALERRLVALEAQHRPRLEVESRLHALLNLADSLGQDAVLLDHAKVTQLRGALEEAAKYQADDTLVELAADLLERSLEYDAERRAADEALRAVLSRPNRSEDDIEALREAMEAARRWGVPTLHAERELVRLREEQVLREAAEAELREACKGVGPQGRTRLAAAIRAAKSAGITDGHLRAANARLEELLSHERQCGVAAGSLRRVLPALESEPWRFQQLLEPLRSLQPWTPELERLVKLGEDRLEQVLVEQSRRREAQDELRELLKQLKMARVSGQLVAGSAARLSALLERAKGGKGVPEELIREAEHQLKALRREGCQREAAEHRLRLALKAKDVCEIERSLRQVRALGQAERSSSNAHGDSQSRAQSARLLEAANAALRHLGEQQARKQAAASALQERVVDHPALTELVAAPTSAPGAGTASPPASGRAPASATDAFETWAQGVTDALQEAKQCGVAPALVDQARMKLREKRREHRERMRACMALEQSLSRKDVPAQEVARSLRKLQRLQAIL